MGTVEVCREALRTARIAQLVEHGSNKPRVGGSSHSLSIFCGELFQRCHTLRTSFGCSANGKKKKKRKSSPERDRTAVLLRTRQALSPLSYETAVRRFSTTNCLLCVAPSSSTAICGDP